jgi:hypothetical protein
MRLASVPAIVSGAVVEVVVLVVGDHLVDRLRAERLVAVDRLPHQLVVVGRAELPAQRLGVEVLQHGAVVHHGGRLRLREADHLPDLVRHLLGVPAGAHAPLHHHLDDVADVGLQLLDEVVLLVAQPVLGGLVEAVEREPVGDRLVEQPVEGGGGHSVPGTIHSQSVGPAHFQSANSSGGQ